MDELEKMLKNVVLGGVGAVATLVDRGAEVGQALVKRGEQAVEENRDAAEELKRKVKEGVESITRSLPDVSWLTKDQREELRRQLDELDAKDAAEAAAAAEEAVEEAAEAVQEAEPIPEAAETSEPAAEEETSIPTLDIPEDN